MFYFLHLKPPKIPYHKFNQMFASGLRFDATLTLKTRRRKHAKE